MRNDSLTRHVGEEELVQLLDHELPRRRYAQARNHVRTCWTCNARMAELRSITGQIVRLEEKLAYIESDGGEWPDLRPRMREARLELERTAARSPGSFRGRLAVGCAVAASLAFAYGLLSHRHAAPALTPGPESKPSRVAPPAPLSAGNAPPPPHTLPRNAITIGLELRVLDALHQVHADLGEPVHIVSSNGAVNLKAVGLSSEREQEIRAALAGLPVLVQFDQPSSASTPAARRLTFTSRRSAFAPILEQAAGGTAALEEVSNSLLDDSAELMAAAHAWKNLKLRFPAERPLNSAESAALARIEGDYVDGIRQHFESIQGRLVPLLAVLRAPVDPGARPGGADLYESGRRLERALNAVFAGDGSAVPLDAMLADLSAAAAQMRRALEAVR
jgi:hypothetical protein